MWHAGNMAILLLKRAHQYKEGRYMLVVYVLGRILILINLYNFHKSRNNLLCIQRLLKIGHFMKSLRINGFKTDTLCNAVYFRRTTCKGLIGNFARGLQEKFYRIFTAMMNICSFFLGGGGT